MVMVRKWYQVMNSTGPDYEHGKWKPHTLTQFDSFASAERYIMIIPVTDLHEFKIVKFM